MADLIDIDVKKLTDKLEEGEGCVLRTAIGSMRFEDQKEAWSQLRKEAESRSDNVLSFRERKIEVDYPNGQPTGEFIPTIDIYWHGEDGKEHNIFEAYNELNSPNVVDICSNRNPKK